MMRRFRRYYIYEGIVGGRREDCELISVTAFREALTNSLLHRMWNFESHIRVLMFEDRIEIESPGGLPKNLSAANYLKGHVSVFRNPILANVLFRLKYVENFGSGIVKINEAYQDSPVKPEYKILPNSITVVLPVNKNDQTGYRIEERSVYGLLDRHDKLSRSEISEYLGLSRESTLDALNGLLKKKVIEKTGNSRSTRYRTVY